jgi:hypothetical protein
MPLKPQDILIALKLYSPRDDTPTYAQLASELEMSAAEVHATTKRLI